MSLITSILPKPKHTIAASKWADDPEPLKRRNKSNIPRYGQRQDFIPQTQKDFGDGGAFPEIHVVQYPLGMGKKKTVGAEISETLPLEVDNDGQIRYDLVLRKGTNMADNKTIHASAKSLTAQDYDLVPTRPDEEDEMTVKQKTQEAIDKIIEGRINTGRPKSIKKDSESASFVKYVPARPNDDGTGASSRIIRISEAPVDPLEPARFKHRKIPRSTGSPPPPVLRSPPRKVSVEEQKNWVIPPCISNWKNAKGYTIPLDKRLANDGRGLQDVTINDNFSKLAEALFIADRHARDEVKLRAEMQSKLALKQKKEKEEKLRLLAQQAREERAGFGSAAGIFYIIQML
jgi:SNW domain-containing protein 1